MFVARHATSDDIAGGALAVTVHSL